MVCGCCVALCGVFGFFSMSSFSSSDLHCGWVVIAVSSGNMFSIFICFILYRGPWLTLRCHAFMIWWLVWAGWCGYVVLFMMSVIVSMVGFWDGSVYVVLCLFIDVVLLEIVINASLCSFWGIPRFLYCVLGYHFPLIVTGYCIFLYILRFLLLPMWVCFGIHFVHLHLALLFCLCFEFLVWRWCHMFCGFFCWLCGVVYNVAVVVPWRNFGIFANICFILFLGWDMLHRGYIWVLYLSL